MEGYQNNSQCILDYLALFQILAEQDAAPERCALLWERIQRWERTSGEVQLAPVFLRQRFALGERDFLLVMAALALEMDGGLRGAFRRKYALALPSLEYGLQLIAPLCPSSCETLAELAGRNALCELLLTTAERTAYPLERPLILCRAAVAFLTGFSAAGIPGCVPVLDREKRWLSLHVQTLEQVREWYVQKPEHPLYLCALPGAGRRSLLLRACGRLVYADLEQLGEDSPLDQAHIIREIVLSAKLFDAPICVQAQVGQKSFQELEGLCRAYRVHLAVLVEEDMELERAKEVVRLPPQLSPDQRQEAWRFFTGSAAANSVPRGALTVGAIREIAQFALRAAAKAGRETVLPEDTRQAMLRRGGALEFGVRYQPDITLEHMVLSDSVREQIEMICQAAERGDELAGWGIPQQREGVTAVFHGPSGTGKTMAACAIANRLGLPLLRADLSQIMDKYVGETEKHLGRLFRSARENRCVLLFDEADSLFGKRAIVSTGHDKYANLSTSYLLQEIEQYDGAAILSTNLLSNFDQAFLRRLHYIVRFSLPDGALREKLWRNALPERRCEKNLPFQQFAQAELSPARIMAAARGAALRAVASGRQCVQVSDVVNALRLEMEKDSKTLPKELLHL